MGARSRWWISTARVDVYVNYSRTYTVLTGDDGGVLLNISYRTVAPVTVVVSKDGYLPTALPYKANRLPSKVLTALTYVATSKHPSFSLISPLQYFLLLPCRCLLWTRGTSGSTRTPSWSVADHLVMYRPSKHFQLQTQTVRPQIIAAKWIQSIIIPYH